MTTLIKNEWYKEFFTGLNCEMWERAATSDWTQQEADFLEATLHVKTGASLLDIPCGFGRHTIELARRGFRMTGLDISDEYVQKLRQQVAAEQLAVQVVHGDLLTTDINDTFDGAYCLGNSFGYVDYAGMQVFIEKVASVLKTGAYFIINSGLVAESILTNFPKTKHYVLGDLTMDISNEYVVGESYMATELTYTKADHIEKQYFKHFVFTLAEIKRLLARYGLQTVAAYNSTEQLPYTLGDPQIYLVARKE